MKEPDIHTLFFAGPIPASRFYPSRIKAQRAKVRYAKRGYHVTLWKGLKVA